MPVLSFATFGGGATFDGDFDQKEMDNLRLFLGEFGNAIRETAKTRKIPQASLVLFNYNYLCIGKNKKNYIFLFVNTSGDTFIQFYDLEKDGFQDEYQLMNELEAEVGKIVFSFRLPHVKMINKDKTEIQALVDKALQIDSQAEADEMSNPQVFISYAHDNEAHKAWVLQLATRLRANSVDVLLDQWSRLGSNLINFMEQGLSKSHRVICICSENYVRKANQGIGGSGYEKQIMAAELLKDQNTAWVIPVIRNNHEKQVPTFLLGKVYIDFNDDMFYESRYIELARDLVDAPLLPIPPLGKNPFKNIRNYSVQSFVAANEKYVSPALKGQVSFDYSNNNGRYYIGQNELLFELSFLKSSDTNIQLTNKPASIEAIAIAKNITAIRQINDARVFDYSSNVRRPKLHQIALLQNKNGFYAAIEILSIQDEIRNDDEDNITFNYFIQSNGSPDFTNE
jgi:hypothetical protein